jgi:hypothetical protein
MTRASQTLHLYIAHTVGAHQPWFGWTPPIRTRDPRDVGPSRGGDQSNTKGFAMSHFLGTINATFFSQPVGFFSHSILHLKLKNSKTQPSRSLQNNLETWTVRSKNRRACLIWLLKHLSVANSDRFVVATNCGAPSRCWAATLQIKSGLATCLGP